MNPVIKCKSCQPNKLPLKKLISLDNVGLQALKNSFD